MPSGASGERCVKVSCPGNAAECSDSRSRARPHSHIALFWNRMETRVNDNLHPVMRLALAPFAPPARTPEEEARWLSADVAESAEKLRPDYEQLRADRIQRRDANFVRVSTGACLPGDKL